MGSFMEQRCIRQIFSGAGAAGGAAIPEGFQEARNKGKGEGEKLRTQFDAFRNASRDMEGILRPTAESVRTEAGALARVKRGILEFQRRGSKFISGEQLKLVTELNELIPDDDNKIVLAVLDGKLVVLGGSQIELNNLLDQLFQLEREHDRSMTTSAYKDDLQNAIAFYLSEVTPTSKNVFKVLENRAVTAEELDRFQAANPDFARNYPNEYLRIVTQAIRKNPTLIRRLEPGGIDSMFRSDTEFIAVLQRLIVTEENLGVIHVLSDDWKKNHTAEYRTLVRDAAVSNPAVLKRLKDEYRDHWLDDSIHPTYGDIVNATFKLDGKKPKEKEAIPMAVYDVSEEWIAESDENRSIFHKHFVDQAAIPNSRVLSEFYARMIPAVRPGTGERLHAHVEEDRRYLLNGYTPEGGNDTGKQGWAYAVLDVVTKNPKAMRDLSPQAIAALKKENPDVYGEIVKAVKEDVVSGLDLADADVVRELLTEAKIQKLSQELLRDPSLISKIPDEILTDRQNAEAVKTIIVGVLSRLHPNPRLLASIEAWQKDEDIVLDLVRRNANVYPYVTEGLKNNREVIFAALKAEEGGRGNFHWNMVPEAAYRDICTKLRGGDSSVQHFLPYLIDPEYQVPEEEPKYRVITDFPENDKDDPIAMGRWIAEHPSDFQHFSQRLREDAYFLHSILKTTPEVVNFVSDENTGMEWKKLWKIAVEEGTYFQIDFSRLTPEAMEGFAAYYASLDGSDPIVSIEAAFLSLTYVPDKVIARYIAHVRDPERLRKIPAARITTILKNSDLRRTLVANPDTLREIVRAYPTLIPLMPSSLFEDYGALSMDADVDLSTTLIAHAPERVREIRDGGKRQTSEEAYRAHLRTFVLGKPEHAAVIARADEKLARNDVQFLLSLLTDLDNDAKAKHVKTEIHEERQRAILAAATPEALNTILKEKPGLQSLVDETKTLEKAAERGDQTLFLKLLPESGTSVLSAAGKLLDDTAFIHAALNKTPQEDHKLVLWQATDRVIAALIVGNKLTDPDVATVGHGRLEGLLGHLNVKNQPRFFTQVIRVTGRTDLLQRADESVRSNSDVYYELLPTVRSDILAALPESLKKNATFFLTAYEKVASDPKKAQEIIGYIPEKTLLGCILRDPSPPDAFIVAVPYPRLHDLPKMDGAQNKTFFHRIIIARNYPAFILFADETLRADTDFLLECLEGKSDLTNEENKAFIKKFIRAADLSEEQKRALGEKFREKYPPPQ